MRFNTRYTIQVAHINNPKFAFRLIIVTSLACLCHINIRIEGPTLREYSSELAMVPQEPRDCGMAKSSKPIKSQHLYHVTFFRNVISDAFRKHFGHFSELYPKCIPNASEMYHKSIPNSNKNTIFLQNKPTIHPETNQISSIHCKK